MLFPAIHSDKSECDFENLLWYGCRSSLRRGVNIIVEYNNKNSCCHLLCTHYVPGPILCLFHVLPHLVTLCNSSMMPGFTDKKTEAQRCKAEPRFQTQVCFTQKLLVFSCLPSSSVKRWKVSSIWILTPMREVTDMIIWTHSTKSYWTTKWLSYQKPFWVLSILNY